MEVSIFAAFLAGLVSFLSPCVLPLVPGYISMLSGIGVEQLKEGKTPRGGLLVSAARLRYRLFGRFHFVWRLSQRGRVVFVAQSCSSLRRLQGH